MNQISPSTSPVDQQLELPLNAWDEGMELRAKEGKKLKRWGSVKEMSRMLFDLDRDACYRLIIGGDVIGFKRGTAVNAHYRVDLLSVWEYRQRVYEH